VRMQGLRPIHRRGHIVVCGSGSIGTGAIDLLLAFDKTLVVVEANPDAALVERARERGFDLLTGDASRDDTLDLCNLGAARGLIAFGGGEFAIIESELGDGIEGRLPPGSMALAAGEEDGRFRLIPDIAGLDRGTRVLVLVPLAPFRRGADAAFVPLRDSYRTRYAAAPASGS